MVSSLLNPYSTAKGGVSSGVSVEASAYSATRTSRKVSAGTWTTAAEKTTVCGSMSGVVDETTTSAVSAKPAARPPM